LNGDSDSPWDNNLVKKKNSSIPLYKYKQLETSDATTEASAIMYKYTVKKTRLYYNLEGKYVITENSTIMNKYAIRCKENGTVLQSLRKRCDNRKQHDNE
jgi:hypothetical protein